MRELPGPGTGWHLQNVEELNRLHPRSFFTGDRIQFGAEHVAAIAYDVAALGYNPDLKVMVNRRVVQEDVPPRLVYRDDPDRPGDSGWVVLAGDESAEQLEDAAEFVLSVLGYLADKFPAEVAEGICDR